MHPLNHPISWILVPRRRRVRDTHLLRNVVIVAVCVLLVTRVLVRMVIEAPMDVWDYVTIIGFILVGILRFMAVATDGDEDE